MMRVTSEEEVGGYFSLPLVLAMFWAPAAPTSILCPQTQVQPELSCQS